MTDLVTRLRECADRVSDMASTGRQMRMSIPVDPQKDDDVFICETVIKSADMIEQLQAELKSKDAEIQQFVDHAEMRTREIERLQAENTRLKANLASCEEVIASVKHLCECDFSGAALEELRKAEREKAYSDGYDQGIIDCTREGVA